MAMEARGHRMDIEAHEPGTLILTLMRMLDGLSEEELRGAVRTHVTNDDERRAYERLSAQVSRDTLLLLTARVIAYEAMRMRRLEARHRTGTDT